MQRNKRKAIVELPSQLYGNNVAAMFANFGLDATPAGSQTWEVRAATLPNGRLHDLVYARTLAGPTRKNPHFDAVRKAVDELPSFPMSSEAEAQLKKLRRSAQTGSPIDRLHLFQAELMLAEVEVCQGIVEETFDYLGRWVSDTDGVTLFPGRSAHLITATDSLYRRVRLPSIVLGIAQDPQLIRELQTGTVKVPDTGLRFGTATEQSNALALAGSFLNPLLGCLLPYTWGFPCSRPLSTVIFGFGRAIPGITGPAEGLAQLLPGHSAHVQRTTEPSVTGKFIVEAIDWWVLRSNQLFGYLTDPATYVDANGRYSAHEQLHWMLTFTQVLQLVSSIQAAALHDPVAQRVMAYTLLGSFADRIMPARAALPKLFRLSYARQHYEIAKKSMHPDAGAILLPSAQRALEALKQVQDGFFITSPKGANKIELQMSSGGVEVMDRDEAAARLMVVHRNATHGYGGIQKLDANKQVTNRKELEIGERLLAQHNGRIPEDIALLPYLYLLSVLSEPEIVEKRIADTVEQKI